ncbi:hypothetical protein [Streptomyces nigrescens]
MYGNATHVDGAAEPESAESFVTTLGDDAAAIALAAPVEAQG